MFKKIIKLLPSVTVLFLLLTIISCDTATGNKKSSYSKQKTNSEKQNDSENNANDSSNNNLVDTNTDGSSSENNNTENNKDKPSFPSIINTTSRTTDGKLTVTANENGLSFHKDSDISYTYALLEIKKNNNNNWKFYRPSFEKNNETPEKNPTDFVYPFVTKNGEYAIQLMGFDKNWQRVYVSEWIFVKALGGLGDFALELVETPTWDKSTNLFNVSVNRIVPTNFENLDCYYCIWGDITVYTRYPFVNYSTCLRGDSYDKIKNKNLISVQFESLIYILENMDENYYYTCYYHDEDKKEVSVSTDREPLTNYYNILKDYNILEYKADLGNYILTK